MLKLQGISKSFRGPDGNVQALRDVSFSVMPNQFIVVHGPSGCGKTTLLLIAGGLLVPDNGEVLINEKNPYQLAANSRSDLRADMIGFVFQQFHLVPYLSVLDNILVPSMAMVATNNSDKNGNGTLERAKELLCQFKLENRANHVPDQLSIGEQQRTAMARAMLNNPKLILADEPTGNLDEGNRNIVFEFLLDFTRKGGAALVVTHDTNVTQYANRVIELCDGKIVENISQNKSEKI